MKTKTLPKIGERMPDGTIYAGLSPDTGKPMYATPRDAFLPMNWNEAANYARGLIAHGHKDWRVPTPDELNVLFENRDAIGRFNESGLPHVGWYWSSSDYRYFQARDQRFSDGHRSIHVKTLQSSVRCVR